MVADVRSLAGAVMQGLLRLRYGVLVVAGMGLISGFMAMACLEIGLCWLLMLKLAGRHLYGHCVAHPAAQEQQGDQNGKQQMAHG